MRHFSSQKTENSMQSAQTGYCGQAENLKDSYSTKQSKSDWNESNIEKVHTKERLKKRMFTVEEDNKIRQLVSSRGEKAWKIIAAELSNRSPRQCRERWKNYLSPDVLNLPWTVEEDQKLTELMNQYGAQWAKIARYFHHRTDVNVKNRWSYLKRKEKRLKSTNSFINKQSKNKDQNSTENIKIESNLEDKLENNNEDNVGSYSLNEKENANQIWIPNQENKMTNVQYGMGSKANEQLIEFWDSNWESLDDNLSSCI